MKIKRLELMGFKSFVDRTVVNFEHQVMGVVGPNGCGKSNIVDSIRWCMGEQSAKHLRGRSMEDVIFSGSESRPGADMAEVTLTFENNLPEELPLEYRDYAEIAVTRRLYRTGDSEYLINKTHVRLKDVTDLFLGTGVGTRAYSIIEQGKIGLIVSAKPEDRRMLIEEAAGITKFKSRKKQAERKMELTHQNLLRVGDIVSEIERNLGSLKRQAQKAERFLSYRNELEDLQLCEASHRYLELVGWVKLETVEVEERTVALEEVRGTLFAAESSLETIRSDAEAAQNLLDSATAAHFAAENEVRAEEAQIERGRDRMQSEKKREETATQQVQSLTGERESLVGEHASVTDAGLALEADANTASSELEQAQTIVTDHEVRAADADARVRAAQARVATVQAEIASIEATLAGFARRADEWETRREKLVREQQELETSRLEHEATRAQAALAIDDLRSGRVTSAEEKETLELELAQLKTDIVVSDRELEESKAAAGKSRSRLGALREIAERLDGVGAGAKALLASKDESVLGLVADRIDAPSEYLPALAALLGERLQEIIVTDEDAGLALVGELKTRAKGRATVVPRHPRIVAGRMNVDLATLTMPGVIGRLIDRLVYSNEDESLVQSLVGDALLVEAADVALSLRSGCACTLVTLDGTVLLADGRIVGGTEEAVAAGMLETKHEIRDLEEDVARLEQVMSYRMAHHQTLRQGIATAQGALERAKQQAHQDELSLVRAEQDLKSCDTALERALARAVVVEGEITELALRGDEAKAERDEAEARAENTRNALIDATQEQTAFEENLSGCKAEVDAARGTMTDRRVHAASALEKLSSARGTLERLERSIEELDNRLTFAAREGLEAASAFADAAGTVFAHKERLEGASEQARSTGLTLEEARREFDTQRSMLSEREAGLKDLRTAVDGVKESLVGHEMALKERTLAHQHLMDSVYERFRGLRLERIVSDYHMRPTPGEESHERITELTGILGRMGSVNLDAVRELEESEKRYTYYSEQKQDLDQALADLEKAIAQMNRESKKLFMETFEAVNARFQEIFPRMFRGGRASLRLTNPEDMLETGIDILAQPPGKKLSSIELMSGGEKALTAVSLIFAIFLIKPSPFCILDEVDAPLDEANVARYNEMIRAMTDRSQFILITHIKRTMQMVDVLHGVTMQEPGVSRLVSVRVNEAAAASAPVPKKAAAAEEKTGTDDVQVA